MGDFNIDLLKCETYQISQDYLLSLRSCYLIPTVDKPTHVYRTSATLIDNIFVNNPNKLLVSRNIISDISDHLSQFHSEDKLQQVKNIKIGDYSRFSADRFNVYIYVNDIHRSSNKLRFYLFADDTNILYADKNLEDLETIVNNELQNLYDWLTANKLTLNINKSNFVIFYPYQKRLAYQPKLCMFDNEKNKCVRLESKVYIKYLGVLIDKNLPYGNTTLTLLLQKLVKMLG